MLIVLSLQPFRASRLRTAIVSSESHCEGTKYFATMQAKISSENTYTNLNELSPTSSHALPGSSSRSCCSKILIYRASLSSADERFFRVKSTLFTNIWGIHRVPRFRGLERVLRALKHARTL